VYNTAMSLNINTMKFRDLCQEIKGINFESVREDNADYFEAVLVKTGLKELTAKLDRLLGLPAWPLDQGLSVQIKKEIEDFGGIIPGQTLYRSCQGEKIFFAMLWPWQDGLHITVKIIEK
jgi:hypothetical protein